MKNKYKLRITSQKYIKTYKNYYYWIFEKKLRKVYL